MPRATESFDSHLASQQQDPARVVMGHAARRVHVQFGESQFDFRLVCATGTALSYSCMTEPMQGSIFEFSVEHVANPQAQLGMMIAAEWPNYQRQWRLTHEGPRQLTEMEREFAAEQHRFEQQPEAQRQGLLGP